MTGTETERMGALAAAKEGFAATGAAAGTEGVD